ncbi:hypothetical protein NEOLEDRAFT_1142792 [Neolentinus lepideus HHB14362 ss-1]|uniref:Uncharacterized protein n=1 Tax=Neolentinus lepideus HHB14362 ss-1 TaxID=1314782 RepID=A0A165MXW7_9AGAM|nr:hypothetical protein NEOLEDRAFT_1142792 [Neolentinus lepideus HHB14362 ss-1]
MVYSVCRGWEKVALAQRKTSLETAGLRGALKIPSEVVHVSTSRGGTKRGPYAQSDERAHHAALFLSFPDSDSRKQRATRSARRSQKSSRYSGAVPARLIHMRVTFIFFGRSRYAQHDVVCCDFEFNRGTYRLCDIITPD